jgi:hypothetical protein
MRQMAYYEKPVFKRRKKINLFEDATKSIYGCG